MGGEITHAVISAHRGLPSAKLFTNLDQLEVGDTFTITVLEQAIQDIAKFIGPDTVILSVLNGITSEEGSTMEIWSTS